MGFGQSIDLEVNFSPYHHSPHFQNFQSYLIFFGWGYPTSISRFVVGDGGCGRHEVKFGSTPPSSPLQRFLLINCLGVILWV